MLLLVRDTRSTRVNYHSGGKGEGGGRGEGACPYNFYRLPRTTVREEQSALD